MAKLRAVVEGEAPPLDPVLTVTQAVLAGNRLAELKATHLIVARAVQSDLTPPRDLSSLTRRQMELSREIEALELQRKEEDADAGGPSEDEAWDQEAI